MFDPMNDKPLSGWELVIAWLVMAGACVGVWYLLLAFVLYPYAVSLGGLFRMAAIR